MGGADMVIGVFEDRYEQLTGRRPFPWQTRLWTQMARTPCDQWPQVVDIPTGLGKTQVIAVWYLAWRAVCEVGGPAKFPRRLVYVVNRRTVVDQTTAEVERLRANLGDGEPLAISTLRGQFADNHEWLADPSRPAVVSGTVDMIGSRLLFGGYRIGFKSRPLHAGFLAQDTLLVHDEAHLEPAFQTLIDRIQKEQHDYEETDLPWPKLRVMALSATRRQVVDAGAGGSHVFTLTDEERNPPQTVPDPPTEPIHHVWRRIAAVKRLKLHAIDKDEPAGKVVELAMRHKDSGAGVLVFLRSVKDALDVAEQLSRKLKKADLPPAVQTLVGTMRGYERDALVQSNAVFARFMRPANQCAGTTPAEGTVYLVCTSAGEVGVDLSADHLVCDLSTFDSMAQRMGRVNRFGDRRDTCIDVVYPTTFAGKGGSAKVDQRRARTRVLLEKLGGEASPQALSGLDQQDCVEAFAPVPTILPATDILLDAWAMTTIQGEMPGRPPVAPYLHGVAEWDPPRTTVAWRQEVELVGIDEEEGAGLPRGLLDRHPPDDLLDDYPLKPHELLSDASDRVLVELRAMAKRLDPSCPIWIVGERGEVELTTLGHLVEDRKKEIVGRIENRTLLLPPCAGGLTDFGTLDGKVAYDAEHSHGYDIADRWRDADGRECRLRVVTDESEPADIPVGMALIRTIDRDPLAEEVQPEYEASAEEVTEESKQRPGWRGRFWHWYTRPHVGEDATVSAATAVPWDDHADAVVKRVTEMAEALGLTVELAQALKLAAKLHDLGKKRELWQRAIGNPVTADCYAKPGKPGMPVNGSCWLPRSRIDYRHEFGSLLDVLDPAGECHAEVAALSEDMQDVVLHLIAAHHGYARPHFPPEKTVDLARGQAEADVAADDLRRRYARLQRRYGRWGLAYLESLLRAADWAASDAQATHPQEGGHEPA